MEKNLELSVPGNAVYLEPDQDSSDILTKLTWLQSELTIQHTRTIYFSKLKGFTFNTLVAHNEQLTEYLFLST